MDKPTVCMFAGYVSEAGGRLIQDWYDGLPEEERDEVKDTLNYLASLPPAQWRRPEFDKLDPPLHEIGCKANAKNHWIRIYGVFDKNQRGRFIFLYGNGGKKVKNDKPGKRNALARLSLLEQGKARTHEFVIEKRPA
ncbi:MAG TPA: hypothetical protein VGG56_14330 [Terracidiphilus sp.]|jgi:hypothetical protein